MSGGDTGHSESPKAKHACSYIKHFFTWLVLRACIIKCSVQEVKCRRYWHPSRKRRPTLTNSPDPQELRDFAKELFAYEKDRISAVQDKAKVVLTLSAVLLALTTTAMQILPLSLIAWLPIVCLLLTVYLLLILFGVGAHTYPSLSQKIADKKSDERCRELASDYLECQDDTQDRGDFLVDVFRASTRALMTALLLLVGIVSYTVFVANTAADDKQEKTMRIKVHNKSIDTKFQFKDGVFEADLTELLPDGSGQAKPPRPPAGNAEKKTIRIKVRDKSLDARYEFENGVLEIDLTDLLPSAPHEVTSRESSAPSPSADRPDNGDNGRNSEDKLEPIKQNVQDDHTSEASKETDNSPTNAPSTSDRSRGNG